MPSKTSLVRPIVVLGAGGGGIGTAVASHLATEGTPIIAVDQDATRLYTLVSSLRDSAGRVYPEVADATDSASVTALFHRIEESFPDLGGLVNVVGGLPFERWRPLTDDDDENLDALLETNLRTAVRASREFARIQIRRQARDDHAAATTASSSIVQIATIAALEAMPFGAGYAASKAALLSYTRTMALEWGAAGIRVNAVAPGSIRVPKNEGHHDPERDARVLPLGRRGTPDDVAGAVLFLLSEASSWITGQVLAVDGGASIKPSYLDDDGLPVFVQNAELRTRLLGSF